MIETRVHCTLLRFTRSAPEHSAKKHFISDSIKDKKKERRKDQSLSLFFLN